MFKNELYLYVWPREMSKIRCEWKEQVLEQHLYRAVQQNSAEMETPYMELSSRVATMTMPHSHAMQHSHHQPPMPTESMKCDETEELSFQLYLILINLKWNLNNHMWFLY